MPDDNTFLIAELPSATWSIADQPNLAVGMSFAKLRFMTAVAGDASAPHFAPTQEPQEDGRTYTAIDGRSYYRPQLRVAQHVGDLPRPEVRFLKAANGSVRLHFELEEALLPGLPADAEPFYVRVGTVTLRWRDPQGQNRQRIFDQATLVGADNPQDSAQANFLVRVGADLTNDEVEPLFQALSRPDSGASLTVSLSFGYWVDHPAGGGGPIEPHGPDWPLFPGGGLVPIDPVGPVDPFGPIGPIGPVDPIGPFVPANPIEPFVLVDPVGPVVPIEAPQALAPEMFALHNMPQAAAIEVDAPPVAGDPDIFRIRPEMLPLKERFNVVLRPELMDWVRDAQQGREVNPNFHTANLERTLPFTFDLNLQANRPIYAALLGAAGITEHWTDSGFGMVRTAAFPNTVYRLPDEIRLAFHREMGTPYVVPFLYRSPDDEVRLRVTLGGTPWHNPTQIVKLRDFLYTSSGGALAAPAVVVGGYQSATLRLTSAFPEAIRALDGEEVLISLENGFQVTLDLSLEFYRFLAELLTRDNSPGLTGEVKVRLENVQSATAGGPEQVLEKRVPVRLAFDDLAGLPMEARVPPDALSPGHVELVNLTPAAVRIEECLPRLLQFDANSVAPLAVIEAAVTAPSFPAVLAPNSTLTVDLKPKHENPALVWNAIQVELAGQSLTDSPRQLLERIHEIFPNTTLVQKVTITCPLFTQANIPDKFANLFRIQVKVVRAGFAVEQVVLGRNQHSTEITLQRKLNEILGEEAGALAKFKYQVQNVYFDHEGAWSAEKDGEGTSVFVFPNPVEGD